MGRKLVKHGETTMMVSLPAKWIKKNELKKGDEVSVNEKENELVISAEKSLKEKSKAVIDISGYSPLVNRILISYYIKGIDELEVNFSNPFEIKDFQKRVINELLGFEIVKQSQKSILIKDITEISIKDIDEIIQRIFLILDSMFEELIISLTKKQPADPVIESDISVNKFINFCLRALNKKGYKEYDKTTFVYGIVSLLEEIGDLLKNIAKEYNLNHKTSNEEINILKNLKENLYLFKQLFFDYNKEKAVFFAKKYEEIKKKIKQNNIFDFYLFEINETIIKMNNYLMVKSI